MFGFFSVPRVKGFIGPPGAPGAPGIQGERVGVMNHKVGGANVLNDRSDCSEDPRVYGRRGDSAVMR